MATIHKEIAIDAPAEEVWDAVRDFGALHQRLVPGFIVDAELEDGARVITFANGLVIRERLVTLDDDARRLVYSATGGNATHHNASVQVFAEDDDTSRIVWITDLLPDGMADVIRGLVEQGSKTMKATVEAAHAR